MRITYVFAVVAAIAVSAVAVPQPGLAQACQRTVSIAPQVSAGEGAGELMFAVLSGGCAAAGEVGYEVASGTAVAGKDFVLPRGRLRWAAGSTAIMTITASIVRDSEREDDLEDFSVQLVDPSPSVLIVSSSAQGRILDDHGPTPRGSVDDELCLSLLPSQWCSVCPDEVMPWRPCVIEFQLSKPQSTPVVLHWNTVDGTALAGVDYEAVVGQITIIAAGQTTATMGVQLLPRAPDTSSLWFSVQVSSLSSGVIVDAEAIFTIGGR